MAKAVIVSSVDTASATTWIIVTQMRWLRARFATMRKRLASWSAGSTPSSQKWSARTGRVEPVKRTFAK